jgi:hypothetical protein
MYVAVGKKGECQIRHVVWQDLVIVTRTNKGKQFRYVKENRVRTVYYIDVNKSNWRVLKKFTISLGLTVFLINIYIIRPTTMLFNSF